MSSEWFIRILSEYWPMFLRGAGITLLISIIGTLNGSIIGLIIGIIRTVPVPERGLKRILLKVTNAILAAYIEFFRGTPMIAQAMVIFYGTALLFDIHMNRLFAAIFIVSINTGAYMAEIVRGGIISVDKGQFEAAYAIGMNHIQAMVNVVLPQAIRNILPATGNEFVINIKDTSVLNVISVTELYFQTKTVAGNNFRYFEAFLIACIIYFVMTFTVTRILRYIERRLDGPETYTLNQMQVATPEDMLRLQQQNK
ncbi:MAG TPA: amino acid ABC transporter permease [Clostridia bacterium]|nr:amino acid ABC transporter permease [Clostridia bacterium]